MMLRVILCAFYFTLFLGNLDATAQESYEELRQRYLSLRNTDVDLSRGAEWEEVASSLEKFSAGASTSKESASALFQAALLRESIGMKRRSEGELTRAVNLLQRLVDTYPASELADDSLIRMGDITLFELRDRGRAEKFYTRVTNSYPGSDMAEVARMRLRDISGEAPALKRAANAPEESAGPLIVLDPGHGGEDTGAVGVGGLVEKDVALDIALRVEKLLVSKKSARVRLTRRIDKFVPLAERTNFANDFDADLFVSIHTNASPKGKASGIETYYLDTTDDAASRKLAERENSSLRFEGGGVGDLQFMVSDLIQNAKLDESIVLAHSLHRSLLAGVKPQWRTVKDLGVKRAPFYVLVGAHMPCVLVELFFIDNRDDGKRLSDRKFRDLLASGIAGGIESFLAREGKSRSGAL